MPHAMMTPYEHYCEAERLLAVADRHRYDTAVLVQAQIHATLACANDEASNRASISLARQREQKDSES